MAIIEEKAHEEAIKYLDTALPLQQKEPVKAKSLFEFVIEEPGQLDSTVTESEQTSKGSEQYYLSKKNVHHIGESLCQLFREPIYKCHELINTSNDYSFGSCKTTEGFKMNTWHTNYLIEEDVLEFESRFESGNLAVASVSRLNKKNYYLALQRDINSRKITTQWFYFRVKNRQNTGTYTFNIVNYVKPFSMFSLGMKPCLYSVKSQRGWERAGTNIEYRPNTISYDEDRHYYTLSFSYDFKHADDEVFIAYCYPYTYSRLQAFLDELQPKHVDKMRRKVLAKTHGDNIVEVILITNPLIANKKVLYISARVHPGETISSFACEAIIRFLLSSHPDAEKLRNQFIIKIIPMLNPDGVIQGNYRTSLSGDDLNRQWKNPDKISHQEVYYAKKLVSESQYKKLLYIDLHGHSKKRSSFMYGCTSQKSPYLAKELPYILSKKMQHFSYFSCNFATPKSKEGTSRIVLWRTGIDFSYTYQLSFCGPQKERRHFNIRDYETIGVELCRNLSAYFCNRILELEDDQEIKRRCEEFYGDQELLNMGNEDTNGSSSELEDETVKDLPSPESHKIGTRRIIKRGLNTQKTENREINNLLQSYLAKYQGADPREISARVEESKNYHRDRQKVQVDRDTFMRQRPSFAATRVSLQEMALQDHLFSSMSSFYGLAADNQSDLSSMQKTKSHSFSYSKTKEKDSLGLLLPNVQKGQYKRYDRYKKGGRSVCEDRSVSVHVQSVLQQNAANQLNLTKSTKNQPERRNRDISLVERIRARTNDKRDTKF